MAQPTLGGDTLGQVVLGSHGSSQVAAPAFSLCELIVSGVWSGTRTRICPSRSAPSCALICVLQLPARLAPRSGPDSPPPSPVHEVHEHLGVLLMFLHLHCVCQDHVQIEHEVLHLEQANVQGSGLRWQGRAGTWLSG